jgi:hypothetical protein
LVTEGVQSNTLDVSPINEYSFGILIIFVVDFFIYLTIHIIQIIFIKTYNLLRFVLLLKKFEI